MRRLLVATCLLGACTRAEPDIYDDRWCPTDYDDVLEQYADAMCRYFIECEAGEGALYDNCVAGYYSDADFDERFCFDGCKMRARLREHAPDNLSCETPSQDCWEVLYDSPCAEDICDSCTE